MTTTKRFTGCVIMNNLFIPLKTEFYDAFVLGIKGSEYRPFGPRWNNDTCYPGRPVTISCGYGKAKRETGIISDVAVFHWADLPPRIITILDNLYSDIPPDLHIIKITIDLDRHQAAAKSLKNSIHHKESF